MIDSRRGEEALGVFIDSISLSAPPANEAARQAAVDRSNVFALRGDAALMRISQSAADAYGVPISAISIISRDKQILLARQGVEAWETGRGESFCAIAIHRPGEALVIENTLADRRLAQHPSVRFAPFIRFYAGVPLLDRGGYPLGAICIADTHARPMPANLVDLTMLARQAERVLVP